MLIFFWKLDQIDTNLSRSVFVVVEPIEILIAQLLYSSENPILVNVLLLFFFPLDQAIPDEIEKPYRSIAATCKSFFQPGVIIKLVLGSLDTFFPTTIVFLLSLKIISSK